MSEVQKAKQHMSQFNKQIQSIRNKNIKSKILKAQVQIERLLNQKFYNPYDVFQLDSNASQQQIKKQYKAYAMLLHPDRCKDPRAKQAFECINAAHKTLMEPEKRKVYLRIMRQAKDRTTFQFQKQNKRRQKNGQLLLPQSSFQDMYQEICLGIFKDLQEKKEHITKLQQSTYSRKLEELQTKKIIQQFRILTEQEWQRSRDKRVGNWRQFSNKKYLVGSKRSNGAIRPPPTKAQQRPHYVNLQDKKKNL